MQLVGQPCALCRQRISRETGARVCPRCGSCVHDACTKRNSGGCRACGAPKPPAPRTTEHPAKATADRGHNVILLGVGLMVAAIAGSTCVGAMFGDGQFAVAGVGLLVGVILVFVGVLRNARR